MKALLWIKSQPARETVRSMLSAYGFRTILEAGSYSALRKLDYLKQARVRLVVVDTDNLSLDLGYLMQSSLLLPRAHSIDVLLIGSKPLNPSAVLEERRRQFRFLEKPFGLSELSLALKNLFLRPSPEQPILFHLDPSHPPPPESSFRLTPVRSVKDLSAAIGKTEHGIAGVTLSQSALNEISPREISLFKKTEGQSIPVICLSRQPKAVRPFRTLCDFFVDPPTDWKAWVNSLNLRAQRSLFADLLISRWKAHPEETRATHLLVALQTELNQNPMRLDLLLLLGHTHFRLGQHSAAIQAYQDILKWNPCLPQVYLQLLEWIPSTDSPKRAELARLARDYCPDHPELKSRLDQDSDRGLLPLFPIKRSLSQKEDSENDTEKLTTPWGN